MAGGQVALDDADMCDKDVMIVKLRMTSIRVVLWQHVRSNIASGGPAVAQVGPDPRIGDQHLKTLLRGHTASAFFMSWVQVVMAAWRRAKTLEATPCVWRGLTTSATS